MPRLPNSCTYNPMQRQNAAKSMIADGTVKVKGGEKMKTEEDWQKNAFAVGFMAAVGLLIK